MTNEQIRLAIAKAKNVLIEPHHKYDIVDMQTRDGYWGSFCNKCNMPVDSDDSVNPTALCIPNWPEDIAAAFGLEDEIPAGNARAEYALALWEIISVENPGIKLGDWYVIHATARQRCLAWLDWKGVKEE